MNTPSQLAHRNRPARTFALVGGLAALLLAVSACGSGARQAASGTGNSGQGNGPQNRQNGAGPVMPGASGKVASVDGATAQVQSQQTGQVAVTWNGSTTFTKQVSATLADVKVGDCVFVAPVDTSSNGSATTRPTAVTAANVRVTEPVNGTCGPTSRGGAGGPGGGTGVGPGLGYGGGTGQPPAGQAPGRQQLRGFGGAAGKVTAVSGTGFTVAAFAPGGSSSTPVAVTVTATTTYAATARGAASDVKVGVCVEAMGTPDDTGAVTATRIAVSPAVNGECGAFMIRSGGSGGPGSTQQES